ncbi:hypothetical protein MARINON1_52600 [Marinobacter salarius]|nr:hypothetical protein MBHK15_110146 [Marinobacter salarius]VXC29039.1 hypothetical protein MARINON1_52600 [Marinobacter salarius]
MVENPMNMAATHTTDCDKRLFCIV